MGCNGTYNTALPNGIVDYDLTILPYMSNFHEMNIVRSRIDSSHHTLIVSEEEN